MGWPATRRDYGPGDRSRMVRKLKIPTFLSHFRDRTEAAREAPAIQVGLGPTLSGVEAESLRSTQLDRSFRVVPRKLGMHCFCAPLLRGIGPRIRAQPHSSAFAENSTAQAAAR
jgi:hypothetical protein